MIIVGTDVFEGDTSTYLSPMIKTGTGGKLYARVYASSGATVNMGKICNYMISTSYEGYMATALAASTRGLFGFVEAAIASGCVGWVLIRGPITDCQCAPTSISGSIGHAVYATLSGLGANASTYDGNASMVGVLRDDHTSGGSTTANIFLTGKWDYEQ
jgi:hypothetical protein